MEARESPPNPRHRTRGSLESTKSSPRSTGFITHRAAIEAFFFRARSDVFSALSLDWTPRLEPPSDSYEFRLNDQEGGRATDGFHSPHCMSSFLGTPMAQMMAGDVSG
jgi:hypothetical protein